MPIPKTREELVAMVTTTYAKLCAELDEGRPRLGKLRCVDDWSVRDRLAVRVWWTESVVRWVEAGRRGEVPVVPAEGYRWRETPRLNAGIVRKAGRTSYRVLRHRLEVGVARVLALIDFLDDRELLEVGAFAWAGRYPIARWISLNTARQYTTARTFIRRAIRERT